MNRRTAARARGLVTFCVFALMAVAVVATETGAGRRSVAGDAGDSHLDAPLILSLVGLAEHLDLPPLVDRAGS